MQSGFCAYSYLLSNDTADRHGDDNVLSDVVGFQFVVFRQINEEDIIMGFKRDINMCILCTCILPAECNKDN